MCHFKNKIAIITGGARGIGKNIAVKLAESGANIIIADINETLAVQMVEECITKGLLAEYYKVDLCQKEQIREMIDTIVRKYGAINILINNARSGIRTMPLEETYDNFLKTFDVSLWASLFASQLFIENVKKGATSSIVNISSVAAQAVGIESASYHLSKAALENLTRYLAVYGGEKGIRVNAVRPGFIVQDEHIARYRSKGNYAYREKAELCHPLNRVGTSDDVANAVLFLASEKAAFITGHVLVVDGGFTIQDQWYVINRYSRKD